MYIEKRLLDACIKKKRKAQFQLYKNCYSMLMSVCIRYKKNKEDATEILNIGFLKILNNLHKYNDKAPFEAWIKRIMINTVIDEYRKEKKGRETIEYTDLGDDKYLNMHFDYNEADKNFDADELERILKRLPPVSKRVFNLHAIDGYSHKEIAELLEISEGTSKWHVSNARNMLKKMLGKKLNPAKTG